MERVWYFLWIVNFNTALTRAMDAMVAMEELQNFCTK